MDHSGQAANSMISRAVKQEPLSESHWTRLGALPVPKRLSTHSSIRSWIISLEMPRVETRKPMTSLSQHSMAKTTLTASPLVHRTSNTSEPQRRLRRMAIVSA